MCSMNIFNFISYKLVNCFNIVFLMVDISSVSILPYHVLPVNITYLGMCRPTDQWTQLSIKAYTGHHQGCRQRIETTNVRRATVYWSADHLRSSQFQRKGQKDLEVPKEGARDSTWNPLNQNMFSKKSHQFLIELGSTDTWKWDHGGVVLLYSVLSVYTRWNKVHTRLYVSHPHLLHKVLFRFSVECRTHKD